MNNTMNPYYIYVTLHLMECADENFTRDALDIKWETACDVYQKFLESPQNVGDRSEYDCIEAFLTSHEF